MAGANSSVRDEHTASCHGARRAKFTYASTANRTPVLIDLAHTLGHDPFVISPRYFPKPLRNGPPTKQSGKSSLKPVEELDQIGARTYARIQVSVDRLKLEAALAGSMAVISGKSYQLGQVVAGPDKETLEFRLAEISQRSVILECEGYQFELSMTSPGG